MHPQVAPPSLLSIPRARSRRGARTRGGEMAGVGSKKFVLKPFKPSASMDQHGAVEVFGKLQQAILKIYAEEQSSLSYEELYRCVLAARQT